MQQPSQRRHTTMRIVVVSAALVVGTGYGASSVTADAGADDCVPGTTGKIAFMLKQQTAYRYLNADIPFFQDTAEAAGYEVIVQSAENDAAVQVSQAENVITQGVDAIVIQPVDFNVAGRIADLAREAGIPLASVRRHDPQLRARCVHRSRSQGGRRGGCSGDAGRRSRTATTC